VPGLQWQLANLLPQELYQQVKQLRGYLNVRVPYKFIGQIPTMQDIGLTVAAKLELVHLDPVAQAPLKIHRGLLY
jgi:hypothetical protein